MVLTVPQTTNVVTLQVFDKDGNLKREWTGENAYTCVGINVRVNGNYSTTLSGSSVDRGRSGLISFHNNISSSTTIGYNFRYIHISDDNTVIDYVNPKTSSEITGNKRAASSTSNYTNTMDYDYNGKTYRSNNFIADFGYGNVNMNIQKVYQLDSVSTTVNTPLAACINIPGGFQVNLDERLIVTYRHLFNVLDYYTDNGTTYILKDDYKNILMDSGTFIFSGNVISYNIKANHLFNTSIQKNSTNDNLVWTLSMSDTTAPQRHVIHYGTSQTLNIDNSTTTKTYTSDATKTLITRTVNVKFPPTVPLLNNISKIDIGNFPNSTSGIGTINYPLSIEFPVPWNKPADTEFELTVQWVEQVGQAT